MSVIDIDLAMQHLLAEPEDQPLIQSQLDASEKAAQDYLQRRFFVDQAAADAAKANVSVRLTECRELFETAKAAALLVDDDRDRCRLIEYARAAYSDALEDVDKDAYGIVINAAISAACLLKLGHLFANREDVVTGTTAVELPMASKYLLTPYRIRMGA
jgi:hypothetical protein